MEIYLYVFINFEEKNKVNLLPIAKFTYNNNKSANSCYTFLKLNCGYNIHVFFEKNIELSSHSKIIVKLAAELPMLFAVSCENFYHTCQFLEPIYNKNVKPRSSIHGDKIW